MAFLRSFNTNLGIKGYCKFGNFVILTQIPTQGQVGICNETFLSFVDYILEHMDVDVVQVHVILTSY